MLNKKIFMSIFLILFFTSGICSAKTYWKGEKVLEILDNNQFLLESRKILKPQNIFIESQFSKSSHKYCQQKKIYKLLNKILRNKKVYYKLDVKYKKREFKDKYITSPVKFHLDNKSRKRYNLEVFLLENGLAQNKNFTSLNRNKKEYKKYLEAENLARNKNIGIWGGCNPWNKLQRNLWKKGKTKSFNPRYKMFLEGDTTSWVSEILDNNQIKLRNGLIIKLQNISTGQYSPISTKLTVKENIKKIENNSEENLEKCFHKQSNIFLKKHLLGKKIILKKSSTQQVGINTLSRYIFFPKTFQNRKIRFFNNFIIQEGFGKFVLENKNEDSAFIKILKHSQEKIFKNPKGAWKICLSQEVDFLTKPENENLEKNKKTENKEKTIPENLYDTSCRIKGNISGSKKKPIKKYHTPLSGWYKNLKYEKCFENEAEALNSGFIKVK